MSQRVKLLGVLLLGVALIVIVIMASGLSDVRLNPGSAFTTGLPELGGPLSGTLSSRQALFRVILQILAVFLVIWTPFSLIYVLTSPKALKRALAEAISLTIGLLAFYIIFRRSGPLLRELGNLTGGQAIFPSERLVNPGELVTNPPDWLAAIVIAGFAALPFYLAWFLTRRAYRLPRPQLELLATEAQQAIDRLQDGANLKDVVMRCYFEMGRILNEEQGIFRKEAMTPREFEALLRATGLPTLPLERLTRLFERVRYGACAPGSQEEQEAIDCLEAIAQACRALS